MEKWQNLAGQVKISLVAGIVLIVAFAIGLGVWAYRADYQVLFADVSSGDAASMTAELDRMKTPYQLSDGGNTILVPKDLVYKTRLKLMGKDLPLHGAVGFEVFNNADFGMTEFVQKVNYQRAIQGELTRTILSIEDIQSARVHLAIPEQGLFKKVAAKPKASVTLVMKPGRALAPDQIAGIQRLVAASVPDIVMADVTVLDQHGVALTRIAVLDGSVESAVTQLDSKRSMEEYLLRKVNQVLDRTFGPGEAIASVDVVLNLDQSRVTTEDVLPAKSGSLEGSPTGVVVRERQTNRDNGSAALSVAGSNAHDAQSGGTSSVESDYQVGRRVEQVVTVPGATRRMTIAVVVKKPLDDAQIERLKEVVSLAAGFNGQRGDAVVVYSMDKLSSAAAGMRTPAGSSASNAVSSGTADEHVTQQVDQDKSDMHPAALPRYTVWMLTLLLAVVAAGGALYVWAGVKSASTTRCLSHADREQLLLDVRQWIEGPVPAGEAIGDRK